MLDSKSISEVPLLRKGTLNFAAHHIRCAQNWRRRESNPRPKCFREEDYILIPFMILLFQSPRDRSEGASLLGLNYQPHRHEPVIFSPYDA